MLSECHYTSSCQDFSLKIMGGGISFIIKKINKILIPFIFFSAIPLLPYLFLTPKDCISILLYPVYGPDNINYPIWFLLCLFWTNMIYIIIHSFCKSILTKTLCVAAIAFSGYLLGKSNIYLPFYLSSALTSLPFFYLGVLSRKLPFLYQTTSKDRLLILSICIICIGAITYCWLIHTPYIAFRTNSYYGNIMEIYIIAIAMVLGLLTLCKVIVWIPVVSYLGRYSIIVLGLHGECLGFVRVLFIKFMNYEPSALLVLILTLFLCWLSIPVFKSIAPHFTAQKDLIHFNPTLKAAQ